MSRAQRRDRNPILGDGLPPIKPSYRDSTPKQPARMSRTPRRDRNPILGDGFPPIRSSYQDTYQQAAEPPPPVSDVSFHQDTWLAKQESGDRISTLEGRLAMQEKTSAALIDRAYKVKEDIIDSLNFTHGTWMDEKRSREMLQEHIRTITAVVKKLNKDIESLEGTIRGTGSDVAGANNAVKNLEMHHVAGVTDLRGRVARADGALSKLSNDIKDCWKSVKEQEAKQGDAQNRLLDKLQRMDVRIAETTARMDKDAANQSMSIKHVEGEAKTGISQVDSNTRVLIEDLKNGMQASRQIAGAEREKLESRIITHMERALLNMEARLDKMEKRLDDQSSGMIGRVQRLESELSVVKDKASEMQHLLEGRLQSTMQEHIRRQQADSEKLKRECREGFGTVHDSITSMKSVLEGKQKILEEQLRKEINQIRKMVVLI